jgi:hypothetical protein
MLEKQVQFSPKLPNEKYKQSTQIAPFVKSQEPFKTESNSVEILVKGTLATKGQYEY